MRAKEREGLCPGGGKVHGDGQCKLGLNLKDCVGNARAGRTCYTIGHLLNYSFLA